MYSCPLASSTHQLPSNLVSPLELSLVSSLYDYPMTVRLTLKRVAALPRQLLNWSLIRDLLYSQSPFWKESALLDNSWSSGPVGLHSLLPIKKHLELYVSLHYT